MNVRKGMTYASVHLASVSNSNIFCSLSLCLLSDKKVSLSPLLFTGRVVPAQVDTAAAAWWRDPTVCPELQESDTLVPAADMWAMFDNVLNEEYNIF